MTAAIEDHLEQVDNSLCASCFDVLERALNQSKCPSRPLLDSLIRIDIECPLFVTWMITMADGVEELRGCIGTLSPVPISRIEHYAKMSAFSDNRFNPIVAEEIPRLVCGISLLHTYEKAQDRYDWEIGTHGILVEFEYKAKCYSATYLPEVAEEHNMTKESAVRQLIRKSGYRGEITEDLLSCLEVTKYQSKKLKMTYAQYKALSI